MGQVPWKARAQKSISVIESSRKTKGKMGKNHHVRESNRREKKSRASVRGAALQKAEKKKGGVGGKKRDTEGAKEKKKTEPSSIRKGGKKSLQLVKGTQGNPTWKREGEEESRKQANVQGKEEEGRFGEKSPKYRGNKKKEGGGKKNAAHENEKPTWKGDQTPKGEAWR